MRGQEELNTPKNTSQTTSQTIHYPHPRTDRPPPCIPVFHTHTSVIHSPPKIIGPPPVIHIQQYRPYSPR